MSTEPVINTTRTIYGSLIQNCALLGITYTPPTNTTLNEKFNVQSGIVSSTGVVPKSQYFALGSGGLSYQTTTDNITYSVPIKHEPSDAALYSHLPFIMRSLNNDLDASTRQKYALRTIITVNGSSYIAYYLKRLDLSTVASSMVYEMVSNGVTTSTPFIPTDSNLSPTPTNIEDTGVNSTNGNYLTVNSILNLNLTADEVAELINCSNILYGTPYRANISEIAICAGTDKVVTTQDSVGNQFNYTEVISATVVIISTGDFGGVYSNSGIDLTLNIGATEPLVGNQVITT